MNYLSNSLYSPAETLVSLSLIRDFFPFHSKINVSITIIEAKNGNACRTKAMRQINHKLISLQRGLPNQLLKYHTN